MFNWCCAIYIYYNLSFRQNDEIFVSGYMGQTSDLTRVCDDAYSAILRYAIMQCNDGTTKDVRS